jgi:hypothetical protein
MGKKWRSSLAGRSRGRAIGRLDNWIRFEEGSGMANLAVTDVIAGLARPAMAYPETEMHLNGLALAVLQETSALKPSEREVIATFLAATNHAEPGATVEADLAGLPIDGKLNALLLIAGKVQQAWCCVTVEDVARARERGADDMALHDTVLLAAAFALFRRYVDGLTPAPRRPAPGCADTIADLAPAR